MATETEKLLLRVEAQTKAARAEMQKLQKSVKDSTGRMEKSFKGPTMALRGLETQAGKTAAMMRGRLLGAIVAVAAPAALIALSKRATEAADNIAKVADKVGLTTDELQELRFAATQSGVDIRTFDMSMQRLSRRVGEAIQGKGELIDTLIREKIAVRDAAGNVRPLIDIIGDLANAAKKTKSEQEALALGFKAFDSEGAKFILALRNGKDGLDAMRQQARDLGVVLDEKLIRSAEQTANKMDVLGTILRAKVNAAILENASAIDAVVTAAIKAVSALGTLIQRLGQFLGLADAVDKRVQLEAVNRGLNTVPKSGGIFMLDPLPKRTRDAIRKELGMGKNQMTVTLAPSFTSNSGSARIRKILQQERQRIIFEQMNDAPPQARLPETTVTAKMLPKKAGSSKSGTKTSPGENITRSLAEQIAKLKEQRTELGLTGTALEQYQATQAAASVIARGLKDLTAEQREKLVSLKTATELVNFVKTEKLKLTEQEKTLTAGLIERLNQEAQANMRVKEATERAKQAKDQLAQAAGTLAQGFEDALISSLDRTGDAMENLKNIAKGLVSDLLRQFMRLAVINPILNSLGLGGGPKGAALPTIGSIPGLSSGGVGGGVPGLASGGPVTPGMPHIVGERGPELFVPKGAGSVVPNHKMGGGGMTVIMDNRGADAGQVAALRNDLRAMNASFEERAINAVMTDRLRGGPMRRAFA